MRLTSIRRQHRRGNYAFTFALVLPVLLGFTAMGVDWGAVAVARIQVQAAADTAAMAASTALEQPGTARQRAESYAAKVAMNGITPTVTSVQTGEWDADQERFRATNVRPNAVRVETEATVPLYFTQLFGMHEVKVTGVAGAGLALPVRAPDLVMVLDVTSSMSTSEVRAEREAAEALLDCLYERAAPESRAAIVTFTGVDHVQAPMTEIGNGYNSLVTKARNISGCGNWGAPACSRTNPSSGYEAALKVLEDADTPEDVGQVIMLMSDGEPTPEPAICNRSFMRDYARGNILFPLVDRCAETRGGRTIRYSTLVDWAERARDTAEDRAVDTYTVFYGRNWRGSAFLEDSVRAGGGSHHEALVSSEIADAFTDVCLEYTRGDATLIF
ncbi:MAG: VWA domain-containing protein [Deltaproteobacteria bacterium]|nr:MAG: VWA domain-containing protein [Deltaproteobacteria bacterium]